MCVEQSTKSILVALGIDYPKEHDISGVFMKLSGNKALPTWFRDKIPKITQYISELAEQRGLAGYGFETGITIDYFKDYSNRAIKAAREIHEACQRLLKALMKLEGS